MNSVSGFEDKTVNSLSLTKTFTHGASAGDVNGDGYPELFLHDSTGVSNFKVGCGLIMEMGHLLRVALAFSSRLQFLCSSVTVRFPS
jgi:hypothetical protein